MSIEATSEDVLTEDAWNDEITQQLAIHVENSATGRRTPRSTPRRRRRRADATGTASPGANMDLGTLPAFPVAIADNVCQPCLQAPVFSLGTSGPRNQNDVVSSLSSAQAVVVADPSSPSDARQIGGASSSGNGGTQDLTATAPGTSQNADDRMTAY